jgi:acyl-CoA thioester hydrolase
MPVVHAHADYRASARFDEEILVRTRVASVGRRSIRFDNEIFVMPEMKLVCTGHTIHALIDNQEKAVPFPDDLRQKLSES